MCSPSPSRVVTSGQPGWDTSFVHAHSLVRKVESLRLTKIPWGLGCPSQACANSARTLRWGCALHGRHLHGALRISIVPPDPYLRYPPQDLPRLPVCQYFTQNSSAVPIIATCSARGSPASSLPIPFYAVFHHARSCLLTVCCAQL